jgi:hypothetical protein
MNVTVSSFRHTNKAQKQSYAPQYRPDLPVESSSSVGTVIKPRLLDFGDSP